MKSITRQAAKKVYLHSKKAFGIFTLTLLLFTSFLIINQKAEAQLSCPMLAIEQITDDTGGLSRNPSLNSDGTLVTFSSSADFTGGNPDGNDEIYLFDTATQMYTQITFTTAGLNLNPRINSDGTHIAFFPRQTSTVATLRETLRYFFSIRQHRCSLR